MKIAVTGANGFVGNNIIKKCLEKNLFFKALSRSDENIGIIENQLLTKVAYPEDILDYSPGQDLFKFFSKGDSEKHNALMKELSDCNVLIHNAGTTKGRNWQDFKKSNIDLTSYLIDVTNNTDNIEKFVFVSSQAAAGMSENSNPKTENDICKPVTLYGKSKLVSELNVKKYCSKSWTIIRPASVFGPGDRDFLNYFKLVNRGLSVLITRKKRYFSLIYVEDLADVIINSCLTDASDKQIYFISDTNYSWQDFIKMLETAFSRRTVKIIIPEVIFKISVFLYDILMKFFNKKSIISYEKINEFLGDYWICSNNKALLDLKLESSSNIQEKINHTLTWYKNNNWL